MEFNSFSDIVNNLNYCNWPTNVKSMIALANYYSFKPEKEAFFNWFKNECDWHTMNTLQSTSNPEDHFEMFQGWTWKDMNPQVPVLKIRTTKYGSFKTKLNIFKTPKYGLGYWNVSADIYETKNYIYICLPDTITKKGATSLCERVITLNKEVYEKHNLWIKYKLMRNQINIFENKEIFDANSDYF